MPQPARGNVAPTVRPARRSGRRTERFALRATPEQADAIRAAAEEKGVSVTDFVLTNAVTEAHRVLADRVHLVWPREAYEKFLEILDRPAVDKPRLRELLSTPDPWDE